MWLLVQVRNTWNYVTVHKLFVSDRIKYVCNYDR